MNADPALLPGPLLASAGAADGRVGLNLRRATTADAEAFARMMSDDAVYPGLMQLPYPSAEQWATRLADNNTAARADHLHLVAERDGELVGSAGLHPMPQLRRRHAALLGISVARSAQRQGVGTALMQALCRYADEWAQILRIELTVFADNAAAIALYRRHGFEVEGTLRGYALRQGVYEDVLSMARWHPSPPQRR
jgi:putative acetyltransferase